MSQERRNIVRELRPLARLCGVELVRDDCGRENVMQMVQTMRETQAAAAVTRSLCCDVSRKRQKPPCAWTKDRPILITSKMS